MKINCKSTEHNTVMSLYKYCFECNEGCSDDLGAGLSFENKIARKHLIDKLMKQAEDGNSFAAQELKVKFGLDRDVSDNDAACAERGGRTFE